jgi:hypothetical protein
LYTYVNVTATEETVCDIAIYMVIWCSALFQPILEEYEQVQVPLCGDVRDVIRQEYDPGVVYSNGVTPKPGCGDVTSSGGTTNFGWGELNDQWSGGSGHSPWGWIQSSLTTGLEATRTNYGAAIYLSSGYRCPHGNLGVGGVTNSHHMRGRAADMYRNAAHTWQNEAEFNVLKAAAEATNPMPIESFDYNTYPNDHHYHAAW